MADDEIQNSLHAALSGIVQREKSRLHEFYDSNEEQARQRVLKLKPVFAALEIIKGETEQVAGIEIGLPSFGHMATVELATRSSRRRMTISTNYGFMNRPGNTHFSLEEYQYCSYGSGGMDETRKNFENIDDLLRVVLDAIGEHIASQQVLAERQKNAESQ